MLGFSGRKKGVIFVRSKLLLVMFILMVLSGPAFSLVDVTNIDNKVEIKVYLELLLGDNSIFERVEIKGDTIRVYLSELGKVAMGLYLSVDDSIKDPYGGMAKSIWNVANSEYIDNKSDKIIKHSYVYYKDKFMGKYTIEDFRKGK
ncbi:MAG: hypothetical protein KKB81_02800 [Candidatus Margulisbacteria bacterium]|nr:hypothetical protein [Candidatus Margulisiibacteriota bacterium]MBU1022180.1 hypothetical protein [Candidatus Margulisiibacteriota bacterium]MBU1729381.1 hypothetical protein [Candidatus Margulisiibacteriota bacterium]MBU1955654.1 hypothetical protein [Candidatus Margulisiibacteriota bacterium]